MWVAVLVVLAQSASGSADTSIPPVTIKVWVPGIEKVELSRTPDGRFEYDVRTRDGSRLSLTPDGFADLMQDRVRNRPWWQRIMNISSAAGMAWVGLGLLGQLAFTGRMLLQWLTSEHQQRSVVPIGFWWMSVAGASMLLVYFVWRKDVIGVLGQSTGFLIYVRNLWFIHRGARVITQG